MISLHGNTVEATQFPELFNAVVGTRPSHNSTISHRQTMPNLVLPSSIENFTVRELVECLNISPPEKSDPISNLSLPSVHVSATPIRMSPNSPTSSCMVPIRSSRVNIIVSNRIQSQEKSPQWETHQKRLERELRSTPLEPILCDSPIEKVEHTAQTEEEFCMGSSDKSRENKPSLSIVKDLVSSAPATSHHEDGKVKSTQFSLKSLPGAVYADSDVESVSTRSTFSEDSVDSIPKKLSLILPSAAEQTELFHSLFHILDDAFSELEIKMHESFESLSIQDMFLRLPVFHASTVFFGLRPDHLGFWKGYIYLNGRYSEICKLLSYDFEGGVMYGVEIGKVEDLDGYGGATLFMAQNRQVYYTSSAGWFEEDNEGYYQFQVHGGFDLQAV